MSFTESNSYEMFSFYSSSKLSLLIYTASNQIIHAFSSFSISLSCWFAYGFKQIYIQNIIGGNDKDQIKTDPTPWIDMEICLFFFSKFVYFNHKIHLKIIYNWLISYHYRKIIVICLNRKILSIIVYILFVFYTRLFTRNYNIKISLV